MLKLKYTPVMVSRGKIKNLCHSFSSLVVDMPRNEILILYSSWNVNLVFWW